MSVVLLDERSRMAWLGYKSGTRGGLSSSSSLSNTSDRVLRNPSQRMENNVSLQHQPTINPKSPTLVQPLPQHVINHQSESDVN